MSPSLRATAPQLAETAAALAQWRSTRRRSARIPEELWSQATELAERYGIAKVAVALKLGVLSAELQTRGGVLRPALFKPLRPELFRG
ncbi:MAG: hypothetical protein NFW15_05445, partial [Candidatus Accumulibacter sp.]|nr:hypothetical protein [Accumulibacter sp.]MCM8635366.1 hypothetical protein [Accumulibacter sp.]MCM8638692.1 hypothetical protein [Accumulibacter sp.]